MNFMIKMHWKLFIILKCITNDFLVEKKALQTIFYYKNALEILFPI